MATTIRTKEMFLQRMGEDYDKAVEKGMVVQFTAHMLTASARFESFNKFDPKMLDNGELMFIHETDGGEMLADAKRVFTSFINNHMDYDINHMSVATRPQDFMIFDLQKDATLNEMFSSCSVPLDNLCLTQSQIIAFCRKYRDILSYQRGETFFLFKVNGDYFVALVHGGSGQLGVRIKTLFDTSTWLAKSHHRVVRPRIG